MQDRYAGDVGDFGKLGLLRQIASAGFKIGINWYHTYKPEEHINADGKHIGFFNNKSFWGCDDELLHKLKGIASSAVRNIAALEDARLIPYAQYYSAILRPGSDQFFSRKNWHKESLETLAGTDIIFCDPDNGLLVKSVSLSSAKSDKYLTPDELIAHYLSGRSVIFYNHRCREKEHLYLRRFIPLLRRKELTSAKWKGLKYARGSIRDFIFILQPFHFERINGVLERMMHNNWRRHFSMLNFSS